MNKEDMISVQLWHKVIKPCNCQMCSKGNKEPATWTVYAEGWGEHFICDRHAAKLKNITSAVEVAPQDGQMRRANG